MDKIIIVNSKNIKCLTFFLNLANEKSETYFCQCQPNQTDNKKKNTDSLKVLLYLKMKMLSLITYPHVVPNP